MKKYLYGWRGKMLFGIMIDCLLFVFLALYLAFVPEKDNELYGRLYEHDEAEAIVITASDGSVLLMEKQALEPAKTETAAETKQEILSESSEPQGTENSTSEAESQEERGYIKWVDFNVTCEAMNRAYQYDIDTYGTEVHLDWISLLAYAGARKGGTFDRESLDYIDSLAERLRSGETTLEETTADMKYYPYYYEAYSAVLGGMVGEYRAEVTEGSVPASHWERRYGLKAFHPIAKGFSYSDYDDFGVSRSYGYKREHLGHDMMGLIGTPIVAVETGIIEAIGWNQYGGWRIGVRSLDRKRYYYYAHLRQNWPWVKSLQEGDTVQAGDVIGYMGHTGYSKKENVNNIDQVHLHFGLQLIFDESQKDGNNQIWISCYELVKFLSRNRCEAVKDEESGEWVRVNQTE